MKANNQSNLTLILITGKKGNFSIQFHKRLLIFIIGLIVSSIIGIGFIIFYYGYFSTIYLDHKNLSKETENQKAIISQLNLKLSEIEEDLESIIEKDLEISNVLKTNPSSKRYINSKKRRRLYKFKKNMDQIKKKILPLKLQTHSQMKPIH